MPNNIEWLNQSANITNVTYTTWDTSSTGTGVYVPPGQGLVVLPAVAAVEPEPDGPLDWLRRQIDEVCEGAWAA